MDKLELLDKHEVAEVLGVSHMTASRWMREGRLPVVRITRRTHRVQRAALVEFIDNATAVESKQ